MPRPVREMFQSTSFGVKYRYLRRYPVIVPKIVNQIAPFVRYWLDGNICISLLISKCTKHFPAWIKKSKKRAFRKKSGDTRLLHFYTNIFVGKVLVQSGTKYRIDKITQIFRFAVELKLYKHFETLLFRQDLAVN